MTNVVELLCEIRDQLESLNSDKYESGGVYTVGGAIGNYVLRSPYNTECEYMVIGSALAAASGNGVVVVSNNNPSLQLGLSNSFGQILAGGQESNGFEGLVMPVSATINTNMAVDYWMPLGRGANIYIYITGASCYAYIALRRMLDRYIPMAPRAKPATHSFPVSGAPGRVYSGVPAGQESALGVRYPTEGQPYPLEPDFPGNSARRRLR